MKPHFHIHGAIRVEYRVRTRALLKDVAAIETEEQQVGGNGALCALALARLGARVRLSGNALGDDSHGRFLRSHLQTANLEADLTLNAGVVTPYAILLRSEKGDTRTLLSPQARALVLPPVQSENARVLDLSLQMKLLDADGQSQSYSALLDALRSTLRAWLEVARPDDSSGEREAQIERWVEQYDQGFGPLPF
jgi:sugar/nucleoside kinase (ribokinase family)